MKKKLFLRLCLMMAVALFIYACRTDHLPENETTYNNSSKFQLTSKRISLNESKHKEKLISELDKAETSFKAISKTNINGRVVDYGNGVSIDTDNVIYIENGPNYHTYTFNIKRENTPADAPIENLVLSPLTDGTYRELLFSYHLTPQEKQTFINGGFVDIKNKFTVTDLEKGTFNSSGELAKSQSQNCTLEYEYYYTTCSANKHNQGEKCEAERPSELVFVIREVCVPSPGGSDGPYLPVDPNFPGGGGGGDSDGSSSTPCDGNGVPTGPQAPASGIGYDSGDGCGNGIPTQPNIPNPSKDPCEKTKALLEDPVLTAKVGTLKEKSKIKKKQPGYGESAVEVNNDGTTSDIIPGGDHEVKLESSAGKKGAYHNHTPEGVKMFSPADILSMLTYSLTQPIGNLNNGFLGMVGTEKCGTCPDGYKYHNYIIRFSGNSQELEKYLFQTNWDEDALDVDYEKRVYGLRDNPLYVNEYGRLNNYGLQKLFFDTLKSMKMEGKVTLQKMEDNGLVQNIVLDNAGNPSPIPCP
ncbi:hypothetical protein [Chryseobacterium indoltheticum]|uniref:hypothetical protein n=1 Tax=Chryseobacterium indoltheticum TaxID=254 RepID=UPI003F499B8C